MHIKDFTVEITFPNGMHRDVTFVINQHRHGKQLYWAEASGFGCSNDHAYWIHAVDELTSKHCCKQGAVR